jgi:hypothetical protein
MRVGYKNTEIHDNRYNRNKIESVSKISNYKPESGGIVFIFSEDKLILYNNDGSVLFEIPKVSIYPSLDKYLINDEIDMNTYKRTGIKTMRTGLCDIFGCLITVWPDS